MSTSQVLDPSGSVSKQEYYSSLPRWRRWLAMLNWRPVVDYELREIAFDRREQQLRIESEQQKIEDEQLRIEGEQRQSAHEQRMKQLKSDIERLDALNSKIDTLLFSSSTSSIPPRSTPDNSEA
ncbi:MAG: hypothetical protein VKO19_01240 [Cyanobacteriota bacterium]|nr:hypothetical protein [Cyanobacteriota bacterium]